MNNKRDLSFDIARSLSVLWVVGVWHLWCYDRSVDYVTVATYCITDIFLGCFFFISGYMLSKYTISTIRDALYFYKKRLLKFWFLYFISLLSIYLAGIILNEPSMSLRQYLLALVGLASFSSPHVGTFWFMTMIMFFYIITPFFLYCRDRYPIYISIAGFVLLYLFTIVWKIITGYIEPYMFLYLPVYLLGLLSPKKLTAKIKSSIPLWMICTVIAVLGVMAIVQIHSMYILRLIVEIITVIAGVFVILGGAEIISKFTCANRFFSWIAYSSLCAYLFHRQVYSVMHSLFRHFNLPLCVPVIILTFLPCALFIAWMIQTIYDKIFSKILHRNERK